MLREVRTDVVINASKEFVWETLTRFEDYPSWNPFATSIEGNLIVGENLAVTINVPNQGIMKFRPRIIDVKHNVRFAWQGKVLVKGVFDGEHSFELESISDTQCRLVHREVFSGFLVAMMWKKLSNNTHEGFSHMNQALKLKCEGAA
ncbi:SRPBCC domain-containing protein [Teredinibacter purpureus]|uniref:SRPBCC domain-containing protein n=1 Tax=Teredinibacter purpureus TaxID=2731756 RepID=UPI0005F7E304|nr:SRPBCC domain-containing protein [Teredinibacter purpureus]